ncbi:hypothetical protein M8C21_018269 [Ambrosia artemisiifolia]|uniref:Uncharacterized protein n=1 Tax=Ambrosia artemisiifolia TaxID=4212 RepID=A0AAD5GH34_AMBAR|nr:hypothetical protein M8C21_018269 [Ambrosia artemisiifolia]
MGKNRTKAIPEIITPHIGVNPSPTVLINGDITNALFTFAYFLFLTVFSVLSTASVVYIVASIYTGRDEVVFRNVMKVIPKDLANEKKIVGMGIAVVLYGFLVGLIVGDDRDIMWNSAFGVVVIGYCDSNGAYTRETVVYPGPGEEIQLGRPRVPTEQIHVNQEYYGQEHEHESDHES